MRAQGIVLGAPVPYALMDDCLRALQEARIHGRIPDLALFLEHPPTVTLGRRGRTQALNLPQEEYARRGIALHRASRGGDATYHAPGQLVLYPVIRLGDREADAHGYLRNLEEIALRTAADFGVRAFRRKGMNGAWTAHGKIAAIGFHLRRWVTAHGMSFNVAPDLAGFATIVPCGLAGEAVTSLQRLLGERTPSLSSVRERLGFHFSDICARPLLMRRLEGPRSTDARQMAELIIDFAGNPL